MGWGKKAQKSPPDQGDANGPWTKKPGKHQFAQGTKTNSDSQKGKMVKSKRKTKKCQYKKRNADVGTIHLSEQSANEKAIPRDQ